MKIVSLRVPAIAFALASILAAIASAQSVPPPQLSAAPKAAPSIGNATPTPADLTQQSKDQKITENVEQTLQQDKHLSPMLKNIQISTDSGVVTLAGQVISLDDQEKLVDAVAQIVGATNVRVQLQIAGEKPVMQQSD
jgi:osmotically-inducible protein OsmY